MTDRLLGPKIAISVITTRCMSFVADLKDAVNGITQVGHAVNGITQVGHEGHTTCCLFAVFMHRGTLQ